MADPAAETTYTPSAAAVPVGAYAPNPLIDPRDYTDPDFRVVDAKFILNPLMSNLLALNAAVQAMGVGEFFEKNASYTIPDSVIANSVFYVTDPAAPPEVVMTLPSVADIAPGTRLTFIASKLMTFNLRILPNQTVPDWIQYGDTAITGYIEVAPGNAITLISCYTTSAPATLTQWFVLTPSIEKYDGGPDYFVNNEQVAPHYFVKGPDGGTGPAYPQVLVSADFPASVIDASAIASDAITTAKILNANVTAAKMAAASVNLASTVVTGVLPVANQGYALRVISAPATIAANDETILDTAGGNAITFPEIVAGNAGKRYTIANNGGTADTLTPFLGDTVGGLATFSLASAAFATFVSDGVSNWVQIG